MFAKFLRRRTTLPLRSERIDTPDADFVDLVHLESRGGAPHVLLLHGLEGTARSHYVTGVFEQAHARGWNATLMIFRGCGPELNRARRMYHSGETTDLDLLVRRTIAATPSAPLLLAGVSLGGNVLLKWLGENGVRMPGAVVAAAAVSVPFDLERGSRYLQQGFARVYDHHFLKSLRVKALAKLGRYPDLFDSTACQRATNIFEFDDVVTAPVHGFASARDYYSRSSSLGFLGRIATPTLLLSAIDDPFLPPAVLNEVRDIARRNESLTIDFPQHGGHVGFVGGSVPGRPSYYADDRVFGFFEARLADRQRAGAVT
jgi:predicted alpha/beta-fold hydrolase